MNFLRLPCRAARSKIWQVQDSSLLKDFKEGKEILRACVLFYSLGGAMSAARSPWPPHRSALCRGEGETAWGLRCLFPLCAFVICRTKQTDQLVNKCCALLRNWPAIRCWRITLTFRSLWTTGLCKGVKSELFNSTGWILLLRANTGTCGEWY